MVTHDAKRLGNSLALAVGFAAQLRNLAQYVFKQVGFIYALFTGQHADGALQPHAGIHVLFGKRLVCTVRLLIVLHKHVVPDFQIPTAGARGRAIRPAGRLIGNYKHLAVRAAGAGEPGGAPTSCFPWAGRKYDRPPRRNPAKAGRSPRPGGAFSSPANTEKASLSLGRLKYSGLVKNSQLHGIISFLK